MTENSYLLGIDGGTEGIRVGIFDVEGRCITFASEPYSVYFPRSGLAEQDPEDWWKAFKRSLCRHMDVRKFT